MGKIFSKRRAEVVTRTVERVVTKIVNVAQEQFESDQKLLEIHLNKGYATVKNLNKRIIMPVGEPGCGKSTAAKLFLHVDCVASISGFDVTQELTPIESTSRGVLVVDTVGFLPSLGNIGKLYVLFFYRGLFPDWLIYPAFSDRIVDVLTLRNFIETGLVKTAILPFCAKVYYKLKKLGVGETEAINGAIEEETIPQYQNFINTSRWNGNVEVWSGGEFPNITGSMRSAFLDRFFKDGKYISVSYDQHIDQLKHGDTTALLRGLMIDAMKDLRNHAIMDGEQIVRINECNFLKG